MDSKTLGVLSLYGTFGLFLVIAILYGDIGMVVYEMGLLLSGNVALIEKEQVTLAVLVPFMVTVIVLDLPTAMASAVWSHSQITKNTSGHAVTDALDKMTYGFHYRTFFLVVILEELFARWFFLGFLPQVMPALDGALGFYAMFLVGNALWAYMHLSNYKNPAERHWLRVTPQFVGGIFFTYVYVKYGLFAVILTHFAANAILLASHKVQRFNHVDVIYIVYLAACVAVSYLLMEKPVSDILVWFGDVNEFALPGWEVWDYVKVSVFITSSIALAASLLLYDRGEIGAAKDRLHPVLYIAAIPATVFALLGLYFLLGHVVEDVPSRALFVAIVYSLIHRGASGSAISKTFWIDVPSIYIAVCILQALTWYDGIFWLAVCTVILTPKYILDVYDD